MRPVIRGSWAAAAACAITVFPLSQPRAETSSAEENWAAIARCAPLVNDQSRLTCVDGVLRQAGIMPDAARAAAKRQQFGLEAPPPAPPVTKSKAASAAAPADPAQSGPQDLLEVTLAGVSEAADGKLLLKTTEGAVWKQLESVALRPEPVAGQTVTIRRGALGGYLCQSGKYVSFRCIRAR